MIWTAFLFIFDNQYPLLIQEMNHSGNIDLEE